LAIRSAAGIVKINFFKFAQKAKTAPLSIGFLLFRINFAGLSFSAKTNPTKT